MFFGKLSSNKVRDIKGVKQDRIVKEIRKLRIDQINFIAKKRRKCRPLQLSLWKRKSRTALPYNYKGIYARIHEDGKVGTKFGNVEFSLACNNCFFLGQFTP